MAHFRVRDVDAFAAESAAKGLYRLVDATSKKRSVAVRSNLHPAGLGPRRVHIDWLTR